MKILEVLPNGRGVRLRLEFEEDLWTLRNVLRAGDLVEARTSRDVSKGETKERRTITVKLSVIGAEFQPFTGKLRIFGKIVEGPEEYGVVGKHHSMMIQPGHEIIVEREEGFSERDLERLRSSGPRGRGIIVAVDHDEYAIAVISAAGFMIAEEGLIRLPGKGEEGREEAEERAAAHIASRAVELASKHTASTVIACGPGYLKELVAERIKAAAPSLRIFLDSVSSGGIAGVEEALRRQTALKAFSELSAVEGESVLERFLSLAAREPDKVAYGLRDASAVAPLGAIAEAVIVDSLLYDIDVGEEAQRTAEEAERRGARIIIVPKESPVGERVLALGGIIAVLRYPIPVSDRHRLASRSS